MSKLGPGWAECAIANARSVPAVDKPAPTRKTYRRSKLDDKRSQLRGAHASSKSQRLEKVLGKVEVDE